MMISSFQLVNFDFRLREANTVLHYLLWQICVLLPLLYVLQSVNVPHCILDWYNGLLYSHCLCTCSYVCMYVCSMYVCVLR